MKRLVKILCIIFLLSVFTSCDNSFKSETDYEKSDSLEMRAVWVNYNELSMEEEKINNKASFSKKMEKLFKSISELNFNTVIVQVRPFSDAFYNSNIFPWSKYISGKQGENPGYDPLYIMTDIARNNGLEIHAWINPYRVSYDTDYSKLSENNPARMWHDDNDENNDRNLFTTKDGIYYNPASLEVQRLIIDGIKEIIDNYQVDGIHIDDYFYPEMYEDFDEKEYADYVVAGGAKGIGDWRRENVNALISGIYTAVKSTNKEIVFGVSPGGNIEIDTNKNFADVKTWAREKGYIDYIMPQIYYGFENEKKPFKSTYKEWENIAVNKEVSLYIGLPLYKTGAEDKNAGEYSDKNDTGRYEFINNSDIIKRQIEYIRTNERCGGFAIYSCGSLLGGDLSDIKRKEVKNLKSIMTKF